VRGGARPGGFTTRSALDADQAARSTRQGPSENWIERLCEGAHFLENAAALISNLGVAF
jgi:hypothetical protein